MEILLGILSLIGLICGVFELQAYYRFSKGESSPLERLYQGRSVSKENPPSAAKDRSN